MCKTSEIYKSYWKFLCITFYKNNEDSLKEFLKIGKVRDSVHETYIYSNSYIVLNVYKNRLSYHLLDIKRYLPVKGKVFLSFKDVTRHFL